jgi:hypothetical protein
MVGYDLVLKLTLSLFRSVRGWHRTDTTLLIWLTYALIIPECPSRENAKVQMAALLL